MKMKGTIYNEFEVEAFDAITVLCQTIGVVDKNGALIAELNGNKIVRHWVDERKIKRTEVLYDQPFDVQYAAAYIKIYELSKNYLTLSGYIKNRTNGCTDDYQTASRLRLEKKKEQKY